MNKYIIGFVVLLLVIGGAYVLSTYQNGNSMTQGKGHMMENTNGKPIAQSHRSYELDITSKNNTVKPQQPTTMAYRIKNEKNEILKNYEVVHEKIMHFIAVRKDLQYFQHIHPTFNESTGEFTIDVTFPTDGIYRLFPDFTPAKFEDNPQLLSVTLFKDIEVGDLGKYTAQNVTPDTTAKKSVGDYDFTYIFPNQEELKAQTELTFSLLINKNGQPVKDLETYLGALGHCVILRAGNLDFIHTHPQEIKVDSSVGDHTMQMKGKVNTSQNKGPEIDFATSFPEPGIYRVFTQFQHQGKVITVEYALAIN